MDAATVSAASGGTVQFDLIAGSPHGGQGYVLLGSTSGTSPGTTLQSQLLPLNFDSYTLLTISQANLFPFTGTAGVLDPFGRATASITLPPGFAALAGLHFDHAFLAFDIATRQATKTSNPVPLDILP